MVLGTASGKFKSIHGRRGWPPNNLLFSLYCTRIDTDTPLSFVNQLQLSYLLRIYSFLWEKVSLHLLDVLCSRRKYLVRNVDLLSLYIVLMGIYVVMSFILSFSCWYHGARRTTRCIYSFPSLPAPVCFDGKSDLSLKLMQILMMKQVICTVIFV